MWTPSLEVPVSVLPPGPVVDETRVDETQPVISDTDGVCLVYRRTRSGEVDTRSGEMVRDSRQVPREPCPPRLVSPTRTSGFRGVELRVGTVSGSPTIHSRKERHRELKG